MSEKPSTPPSTAERLRQRAAATMDEDYTQTWLTPLSEPAVLCPEVSTAWSYLDATHESVDSLFDMLRMTMLVGTVFSKEGVHEIGDPRPLPDYGQDQLRAALVFASAGVDACLKQLLRDVLPLAIKVNEEAGRRFRKYVGEQLDRSVSPSVRKAILDGDPKARLIDLYVSARTGPSLQGKKDLVNLRAALGIPEQALPDEQLARVDAFFAARNEIVHELDFLPTGGSGIPQRRTRDWPGVIEECDEILQLIAAHVIFVNDYLKDGQT